MNSFYPLLNTVDQTHHLYFVLDFPGRSFLNVLDSLVSSEDDIIINNALQTTIKQTFILTNRYIFIHTSWGESVGEAGESGGIAGSSCGIGDEFSG